MIDVKVIGRKYLILVTLGILANGYVMFSFHLVGVFPTLTISLKILACCLHKEVFLRVFRNTVLKSSLPQDRFSGYCVRNLFTFCRVKYGSS